MKQLKLETNQLLHRVYSLFVPHGMILIKGYIKSTLNKKNSCLCRNSNSFAFAGCGWLLVFHLGVISKMKDAGILTDKSICSGTSGGAIAALIATTNVDTNIALEKIIELSNNKTFQSNKHERLKDILKSMLPSDSLSRCNKRLYIVVTKVWPNPTNKPNIICEYESRDHLLDVVTASCFIPFYSNPTMIATKIRSREEFFMDGGLSSAMPPIGE